VVWSGIVGIILSLVLGLAAPATASAQTEGDGRAATTEAEYGAVVWHILRRDPTPEEVKRDKTLTVREKQCSWGVLENAYKIAVSPEAEGIWSGHDDTRVKALFWAFLDRPASAEDVDTYVGTIAEHGVSWTVASILASPEYRSRVAALCDGYNGDELKAAMYGWEQALAFADDQLIKQAGNLAFQCKVAKFLQDLSITRLTGARGAAKKFIKSVEKATDEASRSSLNGTCQTSLALYQSAARVAEIADPDGAKNPVFIFHHRRTEDLNAHRFVETRVGTLPTEWQEYSADYRGTAHADDSVTLGDSELYWPPRH